MSTAGKVLTVLTVVLMFVWIVLVSGVAQLNSSSARRVVELRKQGEGLKDQVAKARQDAADAHIAIIHEQEARDREVSLARIREARAEMALSETREALSRRQFLVQKAVASLATAQEDLTLRNQEKVALEKAKADGAARVDKTRGENAERLDALTKLRDEFQKARQQNVGAVDSLRGPNRPAARPVSFVR